MVVRVTSPVNAPNLVSPWELASTVAKKGKFSIALTDFFCFTAEELPSHNKVECTKPRVFKGPCRVCNQEGHPAAECPERPPDVCKNCKMGGMA